MPISGLVVEIDVAKRDEVLASLQEIPGLEITPTEASAPLVVVVDVDSVAGEEAIFKRISDVPGVRKVSLSYHNFEDLVDGE